MALGLPLGAPGAGWQHVLALVCSAACPPTRCGRNEQAPSGDGAFSDSGDKDDDDDDDADEKMQSSGIPNGGHIRQESQEQSEVDHGDFEMVVSLQQAGRRSLGTLLQLSFGHVHKLPGPRDTDRAPSLQSESMVLETAENVNNGNPSPLEALLAGAEGFPPMLDIPPDADDETMVELAIALSLQQDQQGRRQRQDTAAPRPCTGRRVWQLLITSWLSSPPDLGRGRSG